MKTLYRDGKRYLQVRKSSGDTVLLTFNAHFAVVPSMEEEWR
ncbi:MAG: hypothetical protein ACR5LD_00235 [Symbiopectobacterium sp.]